MSFVPRFAADLTALAMQRRRNVVAMATGGLLGAAALLLVGPGVTGVAAQNFDWGMLFGRPAIQQQPVLHVALSLGSPRRATHRRHRQQVAHRPLHLARRAVCVRLCDGFAFPVGDYHGTHERQRDEAICASTFPDMQTRLFVMPRGSETLQDAIAADTHAAYAALPAAFNYLKPYDQTAACHSTSIVRRTISPLRDFSLRRGDIVMTSKGFRIFKGGRSYSHRPTDFLSLAQARGISPRERRDLKAMETASLKFHPAVARLAAASTRIGVADASDSFTPFGSEATKTLNGFEALN